MMDPATISLTVECANISKDIIYSLITFFIDIKSASAQKERLQTKIQTNCDVLDTLKDMLKDASANTANNVTQSTRLHAALSSSVDILNEIMTNLNNAINRAKSHHKLVWPFEKETLFKYVNQMHELDYEIFFALQILQMYIINLLKYLTYR